MAEEKKHILTDLVISKIDLVDSPANPGARVVLFKRADVDKAEMKTEDGVQFPAAAFGYVPDAAKPSTWKLRLWETPEKKETARQVGMALVALGPGFRGNKVQIPDADTGKVKAKVRAAWRKVHGAGDELPAILKREEGEPMTVEEQLAELTKKLEEQGTDFKKQLTTLTEENESLRKRLAGVEPVKEPDKTPVTKADLEKLDPASREAVEKAVKDASELREKVAKMEREHAINTEAIRIEKKYPNLPEDPKQAATDLLSIPADQKEARERFEKRLEMANAAVEKAITPYGVDVTDVSKGGDPLAELEKKAAEIAKSGNVNEADALEMAEAQNPDLMAKIREERGEDL